MSQPNKRSIHPSPSHFSPSFYPSVNDPMKKHDHEISPASQYLSSCPIEANMATSNHGNSNSSTKSQPNSYQRGFLGAFSSVNQPIQDPRYLTVDPNQMEVEPINEMLQEIQETDENNLEENDNTNNFASYMKRNEEMPSQFMNYEVPTSSQPFPVSNDITLPTNYSDQSLQSPSLQTNNDINNSNNQSYSQDNNPPSSPLLSSPPLQSQQFNQSQVQQPPLQQPLYIQQAVYIQQSLQPQPIQLEQQVMSQQPLKIQQFPQSLQFPSQPVQQLLSQQPLQTSPTSLSPQSSVIPILPLHSKYKQIRPLQSSQEDDDYFQQQSTLKKSIQATLSLSSTASLSQESFEEDDNESTKLTREVKINKRNNDRRKGRTNKTVNRIMSKINSNMDDIRDSLNSEITVKSEVSTTKPKKKKYDDSAEYELENDPEMSEEDKKLIKIVKQYGEDWVKVGSILGIDQNQCYQRWIAMPNNRKGQWTNQEDEILKIEVQKYSDYKSIKWTEVASKLPGRVGKQCRERYLNYLDPLLRKGDWTELEDHILFELQRAIGNKWTLIGKAIQRSDNDVKNHFYSRFRDKYFKDHPTPLIPIDKLNEMTFIAPSKLATTTGSRDGGMSMLQAANAANAHRRQRNRIVESTKIPPLSILLYYLALPPGYPYYPSDYKDYIRQYAATLPPANYSYAGQPKSVILKVPGRKSSNTTTSTINNTKSFKSGRIHKKKLGSKHFTKSTPTSSPSSSIMNNLNTSLTFSSSQQLQKQENPPPPPPPISSSNKRNYSCINEEGDTYSGVSSPVSANFYTIEGKRQMEYSPTGSTYIPTFCTKKVLVSAQQQQQQQSYLNQMTPQQMYQQTYQLQQQKLQYQQIQQNIPKTPSEIAAFQEQARQNFYRMQKQKQLEEQQKQFIQPQLMNRNNNNQSYSMSMQEQQQPYISQQQQQQEGRMNNNYGINIPTVNNNNNISQEPPPYKYDPTKVSISPLATVNNKFPSPYSDILSTNIPPPDPLPSSTNNNDNNEPETDFSGLLNNIELDNDDNHLLDNTGNDINLPFMESENDNTLNNIDFDYYYS